jgi:H+/Cl- antiporter ClcA
MIAGVTITSVGLYFGFVGDSRGFVASMLGMVIAIAAVRRLGGGAARTRYVRERWHRRDTVVALACGVLIVGMVALRVTRAGGLIYTTLPRLTAPPFAPLAGCLIMLLGAPAFVQALATEETHERRLRHRPLARRRERGRARRAYLHGTPQPEPLAKQ